MMQNGNLSSVPGPNPAPLRLTLVEPHQRAANALERLEPWHLGQWLGPLGGCGGICGGSGGLRDGIKGQEIAQDGV